jgi:micrococcal nuclease
MLLGGAVRRLVITVLALTLAFPNLCFPWSGKVVGVSDGDTIRVMHRGRETKIRLFGIDCPERDQAFGNKARSFTAKMVFGKVVEVQEVDRDGYGRTVAWVSVDGKSLNKELLRAGLAWWYRYYAGNEHELEKLESEARNSKIGLWSWPNPVPPWDFRRGGNR